MLTADEIQDMRTEIAETLAGTAVILSATRVDAGGGGRTTTYVPSGTVACHISAMNPPENPEDELAERVTPDMDWIVTLPAQTAIERDDRIEIASTTYNVTALHAPRTWELARRVEVHELA